MELLKERIRKDGVIKEGNVLKVDNFLNHQMDIGLFNEIGREFKRRFADERIDKILTIEASGIGIAAIGGAVFRRTRCIRQKSAVDQPGRDHVVRAGRIVYPQAPV